jgi:predicted MPP superfamily phosphohydrolase
MISYLLVLLVVILFELYCFKGLSTVVKRFGLRYLRFFFVFYWSVTMLLYFTVTQLIVFPPTELSDHQFNRSLVVGGLFLLVCFPKMIYALFHLLDDIVYFIILITNRLIKRTICRKRLIITKVGLVIAVLFFFVSVYGIVWGRYDFRLERQVVELNDLPKSFNGYTIAVLSDFHAGSFDGHQQKVKKFFSVLSKENPDLIVFAGDFVNHYAEELYGWSDAFLELQAKDGKYAILGNHDYGDYVFWPDSFQKKAQLDKLVFIEKSLNFSVLQNEHVLLKRGEDSIYLVGVENWGKAPFKRYGNLTLSTSGICDSAFIVLLSHDPAHWMQEVIKDKRIKLTISGHSHAMQAGIRLPSFQWSPVQYISEKWAGIYNYDKAILFVSRGLGYLGYPARIGMPPEVTFLELRCK